MLFNSYIFILFFLPACILGYYILNHFRLYTFGQAFLIGMSLWFYGYFNIAYLGIIIFSVLVNFAVYQLLSRTEKEGTRRFVLGVGVCIDLGMLLYYKYMDFFIDSINKLFHRQYDLLEILLPLGISFFTFQQISFIVDAYRKEVPAYPFMYYISFVTFFPQLVAGPIVTHDELIPQFLDEEKKRLDWDNLAKGIYLFIIGLSKKVLLADTFGNAVNWGYDNTQYLNTTEAILVVLFYTIQIYFDFSGYCDMAVGIGKMLNIDLPLNFDSPYKALTITEFWERWHMTLTRFFTKYVYIPLGGNRKGAVRTYVNIMIVFLASGFWHGAGVTFIIWGLCHGIFFAVTRRFKNFFDRLHPALNWMITFGFVNVAWVFFRADSLPQAIRILKLLVASIFLPIDEAITNYFRSPEIRFFISRTTIEDFNPHMVMMIYLIVAFVLILGPKNAYEKMLEFKPGVGKMLFAAVLLAWCIFSFGGVSTFLYFNF